MYANKKKNSFSKVVVLLLCLCLLIGGVIGGTIAYLMDTSEEVTNTFVAGDIGDLDLKETFNTDTNDDGQKDAWTAIVTPGVNLSKDPTVTFNGNNVPAYVFVKVVSNGAWVRSDNGMSYTCLNGKISWGIADGWEHLGDGVYYRTVNADATDTLTDAEKYPVISGNSITVDKAITQTDLEGYSQSTLTFSAYAIQQADGGTDNGGNFTPAEAWTEVSTPTT